MQPVMMHSDSAIHVCTLVGVCLYVVALELDSVLAQSAMYQVKQILMSSDIHMYIHMYVVGISLCLAHLAPHTPYAAYFRNIVKIPYTVCALITMQI